MSLNKVILIGNVGKDPDIRYFDSGNANARFSLATSERGYRLANGTEVPERTEWHSVVAWRECAQFVEKYVKKGSSLYVEGKIRYRNYDDKDGIKHYLTEINADRVEFYSIGIGMRKDEENTTDSTKPSANSNTPPISGDIPAPSAQADDLPF